MFVYILIVLILWEVNKLVFKTSLSISEIADKVIAYWDSSSFLDRILIGIQVLIISYISLMKAKDEPDLISIITLFIFYFMCYLLVIKMVLEFIRWLEDYIITLNSDIIFCMLVPIIILIHISSLSKHIERNVCIFALLFSIFMIFRQLLKMILGTGSMVKHRASVRYSASYKIKSILTWFVLIIENLYTLLIFVQFYVGQDVCHFTSATVITKNSLVDLFYYLIITFTTVGFGDIFPTTNIAKAVTVLIALSGMLFTGLLVSFILSLDDDVEEDTSHTTAANTIQSKSTNLSSTIANSNILNSTTSHPSVLNSTTSSSATSNKVNTSLDVASCDTKNAKTKKTTITVVIPEITSKKTNIIHQTVSHHNVEDELPPSNIAPHNSTLFNGGYRKWRLRHKGNRNINDNISNKNS